MEAEPVLKWPGGKRSLLAQYAPYLPKTVAGRYFEPFVGGGAVFFAIAPPRAILCDLNPDLINTYRVVRDAPLALIAALLSHASTKEHFHETRSWDRRRKEDNGRSPISTMSPIERAARFIAINRMSFNGLVRYNKKGQLNSPFGYYENPTICHLERIRAASQALQTAVLHHGDYRSVLPGLENFDEISKPKQAAFSFSNQAVVFSPTDLRGEILPPLTSDDFVFFDPPYAQNDTGQNFQAHTSEGFAEAEQAALAKIFLEMGARGVPAMLSNADTPLIRDLFKADCRIVEIQARRNINCNGDGRGAVTELLILNAAHPLA